MAKSLSIIATLFLFYSFIEYAVALDSCLQPDGQLLVCTNPYSTIGYCCNMQNGFYTSCCYYSQIWALWYFWFGIVMFLIIVGATAALCKKCFMKGNDEEEVEMNTRRTTNVVLSQQPYAAPVSNAPPSYNELQQQGVTAQTQAMTGYGAASQTPYPVEDKNMPMPN